MNRVYGEIQGFNKGACFLNRQELHDSGIHRPLQAGICGSASDGGAESIVVSGGYEDDRDYGDEIIYTGHGGNDGGRQTADQSLIRQNKALATNITLGNPVRVIRGANGDVAHSPSSGFRYDGLYYVHDYGFKRGRSGFRIVWFKLVKDPDLGGTRDLKDTSAAKKKPDRRLVTTLRTVRDTKISKRVKKLHRYRCQICGESLETPAGPYAEAAHIKPLGRPHDGPDTRDNVLCLCPNDHVLFDKGAVHVLDDLTVVRPGSSSSKLQTVRGHQVAITYLAYHRKNFGIE